MSRERRSKGFTLAELMLTTAIIIILAALGFIALINYQKNLKLTEMDNAAREIFVAAQNHLTASEKSGEWEEFYADSLSSDNYDVKMDSDDNKHDYYYVIYNPDETDALKTSSLQYLLPFGSIDDTLRSSGSYIIEYDAKNAAVKSVFFTDGGRQNNEYFRKNSSISWSEADALRPTKDKQKKQERREYKSGNTTAAIGYYGEASVTRNEVTLKEPTVVVHNENTLSVDIYDPNYGVKDSDGNELVTKLQLVVTGMDSRATAGITLSYDKTGNALSSTTENVKIPGKSAYYLAINKEILKGARAEMSKVPNTDVKALKYTITLDQIDNGNNANLHFAHLFPCSTNDGERGDNGQYFTAGEDINIRAQIVLDNRASGQSKLSAASVSSSKTTNSLFASSEQSDFTYRVIKDKRKASNKEHKVIINNLRHLQNLDPTVSDLEQGGTEYFRVIEAKVVSSLNWNTYFNKHTITGYKNGNKLTDQGKFYPIDNRRISLLEGTEGKNITISNLNIGTRKRDKKVYGGLFARLDSSDYELTVENLFLSDVNIDAKGDDSETYLGGIIGYANANVYIENLSLSDVNIDDKDDSSTAYLGGVIGYNNANAYIENVHVYNTNRNTYKNHSITGGKNAQAGGLVGQDRAKDGENKNNGTISVKDSSASIHVESGGNSGGLIGAARGTVTIDNSYAGGFIDENGTYTQDTANILSTGTDSGHAGGLIGNIQKGSLTIEDSFATTSVSGRTAGGLIGTSENDRTNISLKNVYYAGALYSDGKRDEPCVGAIIGHNEEAIIKTDDYINTLLGETMVYGSSEADASRITTIDKETSIASNGLEGLANLTDSHANETHPYSQSLQEKKYPYSMSQDKYYGDWIYLNEYTDFVITKTIHLDKKSISKDQIQAELEFIKNNTGFDVDRRLNNEKNLQHYKELYLKDAVCTPSDDVYTQACTFTTKLETGYYYQFTEVNNGINNTNTISKSAGKNDTAPHDYDHMNDFSSADSIKSSYVSQSDTSYLNTEYEVSVQGDSKTYLRRNSNGTYQKTQEEKNATNSIGSGKNTQIKTSVYTGAVYVLTLNDNSYKQINTPVFNVSFDNTYEKNAPKSANGLIYYEGYSSIPTGQANKYGFHSIEYVEDENGNQTSKQEDTLINGTGNYAVEDGYLITLDDDNQKIRFNKYNGEGTYHSITYWVNQNVLTEVRNSDAEKYGIDSSKKAYHINLGALKNNIIGGDDDQVGMITMRILSDNKEYDYTFNRVFGNCVMPGANQSEDTYEIRSADQLKRFTTWTNTGNQVYSTRMFGQGGLTIRQMLDIDMSGRSPDKSFHTIERMQGSTYDGNADNKGPVKLLNLNNTFTKSMENGANINDLILSFNIQADNDQLPSVNNNYGLITAYMQGSHINNVTVQDTTVGKGNIGSVYSRVNSFGIIGMDSWGSSITNVAFRNITFNGSSIYGQNIGLIGNANGTTINNINVENVSYQNCTIQADNFGGIVGYQNQGSLSNVAVDGMTFENANISGTNAGGIVGCLNQSIVSNITVHNLSFNDNSNRYMNNSIDSQYFGGAIGTNQGTINGITISASDIKNVDTYGISMTGLKINSQMFGGVIGYNKGTINNATVNNQIKDSQFSDIQITGNDFSDSTTQYPNQSMYNYGAVVGNNEGTLENFSMSNVSMTDNTFSYGDNVNIGLLAGINQLNINNSNNPDTHSIHDLTINDCYVPDGNSKKAIDTYAFIGKNSSLGNQYYNGAVINSVVIRDFKSGGHGFVYQNVKDGLIKNCSILTTNKNDYEPVTRDNQTVDYDVTTSIYDRSIVNDSSFTQILNSDSIFALTVSP